MDALPNAVLLSRPLHAEELVRSVRSALKARARQYEARDRMQELQMREAQLHESEAKFHAIADSVDQIIWSAHPPMARLGQSCFIPTTWKEPGHAGGTA